MLDMSKLRYGGMLRLLPMDLLLHQRFDSLEKIGSLKLPVLLIHGTDDVKVPYAMTERLHAAAHEPKEVHLVKGGGHANSGSIGWVEYRDKVTTSVSTHVESGTPRTPD